MSGYRPLESIGLRADTIQALAKHDVFTVEDMLSHTKEEILAFGFHIETLRDMSDALVRHRLLIRQPLNLAHPELVSVADLGFQTPCLSSVLQRRGIFSLLHLVMQTETQLLNFPGISAADLADIKASLGRLGFHLRREEPPAPPPAPKPEYRAGRSDRSDPPYPPDPPPPKKIYTPLPPPEPPPRWKRWDHSGGSIEDLLHFYDKQLKSDLAKLGFHKLGQLANCTRKELVAKPGMDWLRLNEIERELAEYGLSLAQEPTPPWRKQKEREPRPAPVYVFEVLRTERVLVPLDVAGITRLDRLQSFTPSQLLGIRGIGPSVVREIQKQLAEVGLSLKPDPEGTVLPPVVHRDDFGRLLFGSKSQRISPIFESRPRISQCELNSVINAVIARRSV